VIYILFSLIYISQICVSSHIPLSATHSKRGQVYSSTSPPPGSLVVRQTNPQKGDFQTSSLVQASTTNKSTSSTNILYAFKVTPPILTLWLEIESLSRYQSVPPVAVVKMRQVPPSGYKALGKSSHNLCHASWEHWSNHTSSSTCRFEMYNVNAINSSGTGTDTQALALTAEGQKLDFIFGSGTAWFDTSDIVVEAPKLLPFNAQTPPNLVYLDRPWSPYAAVTFQSSFLSNIVNPLGWIPWSRGPVTGNKHATYQEFGNYGPGSPTRKRQMSSVRSAPLRISDVLGSDYATWAH
ncbi:hypothetical protein PSHT_07005, partial [Puccinia striiformis]